MHEHSAKPIKVSSDATTVISITKASEIRVIDVTVG